MAQLGAIRHHPDIARAGAPDLTVAAARIEVDLGPIAEGQVIKVFWRGKPIFINHRSKKEIEEALDKGLPQPIMKVAQRALGEIESNISNLEPLAS